MVTLMFLLTLFIAGTGLTFLILGIIFKKPGQWITGIISLVAAFFFLIFSFYLLGKFVSERQDPGNRYENYKNQDYYYEDEYSENDNSLNHSNEDIQNDNPSQEEISSCISGFIRDYDNSLINIKVFPASDLYNIGITVVRVDFSKPAEKTRKLIPLEIRFTNKFKGTLQLYLFDKDENELGNSNVEINQQENTTFLVTFVFDKNTSFLKADHARLKTSY